MPAIAQKRRKKTAKEAPAPPERQALLAVIAASAAGCLLGLSAPGLNQWYLAWVGLIPLFMLSASATTKAEAFLRGLFFGTFYNLVYLNWYLGLYPLNWLGFNDLQSTLMALCAWLVVSVHQGLIVGLFALVTRALPLTGAFIPQMKDGKFALPSLFVLPLLYVLFINKIGNAPDALGVPWTMLAYSQYKQLPLIQSASVIGGIGIDVLIALVNVSLAGLVATLTRKFSWHSLAAPTVGVAVRQVLTVALALCLICAWGLSSLTQVDFSPRVPVSIVQSNVNIDMQKTEHKFTLAELLSDLLRMTGQKEPGLVILTENAVPTYLSSNAAARSFLSELARARKFDLIVGALDRDDDGRPYNSAFGITDNGTLLDTVYHKRYLVPFGEYTPLLVQYMPEWIQRLTNTPAGGGFAAGKEPALLSMTAGAVAPLICFETISPELVAASVRKGGQLLVNISDLAWFHESMIGDQMIAFSVLRAVESHRYFIFAANSGPSAIIEPTGRIAEYCPVGKESVLSGKVELLTTLTPFTSLFR